MVKDRHATADRNRMVADNAVCYIHTKTPAGTGCQRCDEPICSSCMRTASVGFHCPQCTKTGSNAIIRPGQVVGTMWVSFGLMGIAIAMFIAQLSSGEELGLRSEKWELLAFSTVWIHDGEVWRALTGLFLTDAPITLAVTMAAFYFGGRAFESIDPKWFLMVATSSAAAAGSAAILLEPGVSHALGGSTGAGVGVATVYFMYTRGQLANLSRVGPFILLYGAFMVFSMISTSLWGFASVAAAVAVAHLLDQFKPYAVAQPGTSPVQMAQLFTAGITALYIILLFAG